MLDTFARDNFLEYLTKNEPASGELTLDLLTHFVARVFIFLANMAAHCSPVDHQVESMLQAAVQEEMGRYLLDWLKRTPIRHFPLRQSPESVSMVWSWAIFGAAIQWSRGDMALPADQMAAELVDILSAPLSI